MSATRLFVGNLPDNTEENEVRSAFSAFGEITNLDIKFKPGEAAETKKFAFVSLSASNVDVESCIKHFSNEEFKGHRLYVTRARESFLERLQRERELAQKKDADKVEKEDNTLRKNPVIRLGDKLNPRKRKLEDHNPRIKKHLKVDEVIDEESNDQSYKTNRHLRIDKANDQTTHFHTGDTVDDKNLSFATESDKKKHEAEMKRLDSMKKKRQEFKEKQMIIKSGLNEVDKVKNKKITFTDNDDDQAQEAKGNNNKVNKQKLQNSLFDDNADDSSDSELNFEVKKQYEGKKGQKVLDLQSRYKSDKRFTLDERFLDDEQEEEKDSNEKVELDTIDEKTKQMNILQDVLGVTIKQKHIEINAKKSKPLGMLRFDPLVPDHAKFLAPVESKQETTNKCKKKSKQKQEEVNKVESIPEASKVEVSKEQFYKISDTLKEAIAQPSSFSLRSLFGNNNNVDEGPQEQEIDYIPIEAPKAKKVKNPLNPKENNPFVYDTSDSENEEQGAKEVKTEVTSGPATETKAVWKENLFFSKSDPRLIEGLAYFSKATESEKSKERRELKSLMKKRIYNKDRKSQMFKKKIGGKKKSMKKPYRKR